KTAESFAKKVEDYAKSAFGPSHKGTILLRGHLERGLGMAGTRHVARLLNDQFPDLLIRLDSDLTFQDVLSQLHKGDPHAANVFARIGEFTAHAIAKYDETFHMKNVILLDSMLQNGEVMDIILSSTLGVLAAQYPHIHIQLSAKPSKSTDAALGA